MKRNIRRSAKRAALLALFAGLFAANTAYGYWVNEKQGPGVAYWVEDGAPGETAADGTGTNEANAEQAAGQSGGAGAENAAGTETNAGTNAGSAETAPGENTAEAEAAESGAAEQPGNDDGTGTGENGAEAGAADGQQTSEDAEAAQPENPNLVVSNGRTLDLTKPMIALTYDDGPLAQNGNRIMNTLEQYNGRATFFMVGERVRSFAAEVQRMAADGHEVANHTMNHKYLNKYDAATIRAQVESCNNVIQEVCGVRPTLMRLPGGNKNSTVLQNVNMPIILWNIDTLDWKHRNAAKTVAAVLGAAKDGDIVLMHELYSQTADATDSIVPQLAAAGFQFVTVSELAQFKGKTLSPNQVYYSMR